MQPFPFFRLAAALLLASLVFIPAPATAHAIIIAANPAVDAVLRGPTIPVSLRFNSRIDQERSRLTIIRPDASSMSLALAPSTSPDTLAATIKDLPAGQYRLHWQVLAVDGHITRGDIPFTIAP